MLIQQVWSSTCQSQLRVTKLIFTKELSAGVNSSPRCLHSAPFLAPLVPDKSARSRRRQIRLIHDKRRRNFHVTA